mgnify:FL=1
MLEFMGRLSVREMQSLVATVLFEATPRYRHKDVVGHLIGDLLVYYADLLLLDPPFGMCSSFPELLKTLFNPTHCLICSYVSLFIIPCKSNLWQL